MINLKKVPLLFLDIDGTVRQGKSDALGKFVNGPEDVIVFPEAVEMMRRWKKDGGRIVGVSNQGGIALGLVNEEDVRAAMRETLRQCGNLFDEMSYCVHHPSAQEFEKAFCFCRKPKPGMLFNGVIRLRAKHSNESYPPHMTMLVGDRIENQKCAEFMGIDFMWANEWRAQANDK